MKGMIREGGKKGREGERDREEGNMKSCAFKLHFDHIITMRDISVRSTATLCTILII